jgi:hypothetical protein
MARRADGKKGRPSKGPHREVRAQLPIPLVDDGEQMQHATHQAGLGGGAGGKIGRPSKGPRREVRAQLPIPLVEAVYSDAERRGMTVTDWLGETLSREVHVPYYFTQEALTSA